MKKTLCHEMCSTKIPPMIGPAAVAVADGADPDADGPVELVGWKGRLQEGQGVGKQQRPEGPLEPSEEDDAVDGSDEADGHGGEREADHADQEDPAAAEAVAEFPAEDQRDGNHQQVGVGHPLQVGQRGVEVLSDVGLATATTDPSMPTMITPSDTLDSVSHGLFAELPVLHVPSASGSGALVLNLTHSAIVAESANVAQCW